MGGFQNLSHYVTGIQVKKKKTEKCILYTGIHFSFVKLMFVFMLFIKC